MRWAAWASFLVLFLMGAAPAHATLPGENGKIVFVSYRDNVNGEIYVMNPDGSGQTRLTNNSERDSRPSWSPDGRRIAYKERNGGDGAPDDLRVMNADGSGDMALLPDVIDSTNIPPFNRWSPNGDFIVTVLRPTRIAVVNAGTGAWEQIATGSVPSWSPDGDLIAFRSPSDPLRIDAAHPDGSGYRILFTATGFSDASPAAWSPDGRYLLVAARQFTPTVPTTLYLVDVQGTDPAVLVRANTSDPDWSPDGTRLAAQTPDCTSANCPLELITMDPDGSDVVPVSPETRSPRWAPDGSRILVVMGPGNAEIKTVTPDGSTVVNLTNNPARDEEPDWQRLPIDTGYVRPKGATPLRTSLVPAYQQCTSPNRQHGPPLAFPSCSPPVQESDWLTIGTGDANGQATQSVGSVRFEPQIGNPTTAMDEADVGITVSITDVRQAAGLADYTGEIQVRASLRITDRRNANAPAGGMEPATVTDIPLNVTTPCAATADPNTGSTCAVTTSIDAIAASTIRERERTIWQLGSIEVYECSSTGRRHGGRRASSPGKECSSRS